MQLPMLQDYTTIARTCFKSISIRTPLNTSPLDLCNQQLNINNAAILALMLVCASRTMVVIAPLVDLEAYCYILDWVSLRKLVYMLDCLRKL